MKAMTALGLPPLLVLALVVAPPALAAPKPADFAYGVELTPHGESAALWRLELPEHVYRNVTRADLGDLRVFNGAGESVPFMLERAEAEITEAAPAVALPFFPLRVGRAGSDGHGLRIVADERGRIVEVMSEARSPGEAERIGAYVIDASALDRPLTGLSLEWERPAGDDFAVSVRVEHSQDLVNWHTWLASAGLADLRAQGAALRHGEIVLPARQTTYLRLSWPEALEAVRLTGVTATLQARTQPQERRWERVLASEVSNGTIRFVSPARWPVDRVNLVFAEGNAAVHGMLHSRADEEQPWRARRSQLFYQFQQDGVTLRSQPAELPPTGDRHWRLTAPDSVAATAPPQLELGWLPHTLTFLAQGSPPYTLAYGSADVGPPASSMQAALRAVREVAPKATTVRIGEPMPLGGAERLVPTPPGLAWRKWLLWAVLVLGVVLLGWMVRGAHRQLASG